MGYKKTELIPKHSIEGHPTAAVFSLYFSALLEMSRFGNSPARDPYRKPRSSGFMLIERLVTSTLVLGFVLSAAKADTMTFSTSSSFLAQLGAQITDDYSAPGYVTNGVGNTSVLTDAQMSGVLGETTYHATGFSNFNLVNSAGTPSATYCAGCNGSFQLGFTSTTVGDSSGVFGVGFDAVFVFPVVYAFVTFGDSTTASYLLTSPTSYFGITSTLEIRTIDVGSIDGSATTQIFAQIDNLTIGPAVPEPAGWLLLATVISLVALLRHHRARRTAC